MMTPMATAAIAIVSVAMYQVCMRMIPTGLNPIGALVIFYATALVFTLVVAKFVPVDAPSWSLAEFSWVAVFVGIAIVGIELGFLLMYRTGWHLSAAPIVVMGGAAALLAPIAILVFRQPMTLRYVLGIALCLVGVYLLSPPAK
ncbi:MAG: EamA family transporter [Woeseiaceae bacterium]